MRPALAALALRAACASAPRGGASDPQAEGERIYRGHCAACHRLRDPKEQTAERWAWAVDHYGPRAHLSEADRRLVLGYLQAHAKDAPAPPPAR